APPSAANMFGRYASPSAEAIMERVDQLSAQGGFKYSAADWDAFKDLQKRVQGPAGDQIRSFTLLVHHLAFFDALGKQLQGQTDSQAINAITNSVAKQFGRPEITSFDLVKKIVGDEATKAVLGVPGTGADRNAAQSDLASFDSPE